MPSSSRPQIGISSCLLGEPVRYDGRHKQCPAIIDAMTQHFELISICPEMAIGLGVPRETIQLVELDNEVHCLGSKNSSLDVTQPLIELAQQQHQRLAGYIFKRGSPSCGIQNVKIIKQGELHRKGVGIYAQQLMARFPNMPVAEESQLATTEQQRFIEEVFAYHQTVLRP